MSDTSLSLAMDTSHCLSALLCKQPPPLPAHALPTCAEGESGKRKETMEVHNVACD